MEWYSKHTLGDPLKLGFTKPKTVAATWSCLASYASKELLQMEVGLLLHNWGREMYVLNSGIL